MGSHDPSNVQSSHLAKAQNATARDVGQGISLPRRSGPILPDGLGFFATQNTPHPMQPPKKIRRKKFLEKQCFFLLNKLLRLCF